MSQCLQIRLRVRGSLCIEANSHTAEEGRCTSGSSRVCGSSFGKLLEALWLFVQRTYKKRQRKVDKEPFALQPVSWKKHIKLMLLLALLASNLNFFPSCRKELVLRKWKKAAETRQ